MDKARRSMALRKIKTAGQGSAAQKYDILTILGTFALSQDRRLQRQTLRLICLITARYNWQNDLLSVGQVEMARLWSVDPRTVKRELAALRERGWLIEQRGAAPGRVTQYGLGLAQILEDTRTVWEQVGSDLVERLSPSLAKPTVAPEEIARENVVPFPQGEEGIWAEAGAAWSGIARRLYAEDASVYRAWIAVLRPEQTAQELILHAPSPYHASYIKSHFAAKIAAALRRVAPGLRLRVMGE